MSVMLPVFKVELLVHDDKTRTSLHYIESLEYSEKPALLNAETKTGFSSIGQSSGTACIVFYHRQVTSADTSTRLSFLELYSPEINVPTLFYRLSIYYKTLDCSPIACLSDLHPCVCSNRGSLGIPAGTTTPHPECVSQHNIGRSHFQEH